MSKLFYYSPQCLQQKTWLWAEAQGQHAETGSVRKGASVPLLHILAPKRAIRALATMRRYWTTDRPQTSVGAVSYS
ncbi:MAG: hypothetical protein JJT82_02305 [Legionellaceae bacterium]|nr:hypothetical protein [Legionellaceae bacterium]